MQKGLHILREASPYEHPPISKCAHAGRRLCSRWSPSTKLSTPKSVFGPVLFIVAAEGGDAAVAEGGRISPKTRGAISCYLYSTDEAFIDRSAELYARVGANLSINLTGAMWINFAAAYSDYHVHRP
jgi:hypothetical protein